MEVILNNLFNFLEKFKEKDNFEQNIQNQEMIAGPLQIKTYFDFVNLI